MPAAEGNQRFSVLEVGGSGSWVYVPTIIENRNDEVFISLAAEGLYGTDDSDSLIIASPNASSAEVPKDSGRLPSVYAGGGDDQISIAHQAITGIDGAREMTRSQSMPWSRRT